MEIQSKRARIIEQVLNRLKSDERPAVTCSLLVSPAGIDADGSFEWPVVDRWIAEVYSNEFVTVKGIVEANGDTGIEQYKSMTSSVAECADLLNLSGGDEVIRFLIEKLFAGKEQLVVAKRQALDKSVVSEVTGPGLFIHLPAVLTEAIVSLNASGETTPTFESARLHKTFFLECWEHGLRETCTESQMRSFISQWNKKFGRKTDSSGNFLFKAPANAKNARLGYIRALKRPE